MRISLKYTYISRISQRSFLTISSAFVGLTFSVYRFLGVRSFSLTSRSSRLILQYSALSASSMNLSTSKISTGILFALAGSYRASLSILSFAVLTERNQHCVAGKKGARQIFLNTYYCVIKLVAKKQKRQL
jgi:hypothetical protein